MLKRFKRYDNMPCADKMHLYQWFFWIMLGFFFSNTTLANTQLSYVNKFTRYWEWAQHLPTTLDQAFLDFIEPSTPLTKKLREKWLYQLAYNQDWTTFEQHYQGSSDTNLQCYAQTALYLQGRTHDAILGATPIWLNGNSLPKACDFLFTTLLKKGELSDDLLYQRIVLALHNNNVSLAQYILKQYHPARLQEAQLLADISQKPLRIVELQPSQLHSELYLYGLKQIASRQLDKAIDLSNTAHAKKMLDDKQQQSFFAYIALQKAIKNQPDALIWFTKVKPAFYSEALLDWEIRYALNHRYWRLVLELVKKANNNPNPSYQYWTARAKQALGQSDQANALYRQLASKRNYYGFLASHHLKQNPSFENEPAKPNPNLLLPYQPILLQIEQLYRTHQTVQASRLLNDFTSELPKHEKSALAFWIADHLQWHGKSIYLSSHDDLINQLSLRFPLAHHDNIAAYSKNYHIPKEFIYAIIRQESAFQEDVVSLAGANGLMQVMPATAHLVAKREHIAYSDKSQLLTSQKNIHIGTAYLGQLARQFHQHPVLMAAAYNAGPRQANFWLKHHTPKDLDIWIETLPWRETRNYLKNIIAFYAVYQYRMQQPLNLNGIMRPF